jgi:DNA-binding XRE family transcriptional regulator
MASNDDDTSSRGPGRPPHEPTETTTSVVEALAMQGWAKKDIAEAIGISKPTLNKHYEEILESAQVMANAQVVQTAFEMATSGSSPSMTRYWLNCRTDWQPSENVDITSDGDKIESPQAVVMLPDNGKRDDDGE